MLYTNTSFCFRLFQQLFPLMSIYTRIYQKPFSESLHVGTLLRSTAVVEKDTLLQGARSIFMPVPVLCVAHQWPSGLCTDRNIKPPIYARLDELKK